MTPIDLAQSVLLAASLSVAAYAAFRKHNHVEAGLRAQLDQALEENKRLDSELSEARVALHAATLKITPEVGKQYAKVAVDYAEQMGGSNEEKLRHAVGCFDRLDQGDNGKRDWTDAQARIFIEAEIANR